MEICYLHDIVSIYGCIVSTYVTSNDEYSAHTRNTPFHSLYIPPLTINGYMERIFKYFNCSAECYLLSLIYIDRLIRLNSFVINGYSIYRVVLVSLMIAAKYFDDVYFTNAFYADVGGITVDELNMLEVDFLCRICFNLYVTPQDYQHYYKDICEHCHTLCRNCGSFRLPMLFNCTPYEETPLLRFKQKPNLSPYASGCYSSTYDYRTQNSLFDYSYASGMYPSDSNYVYYSNMKGYSNQGVSTMYYPVQPSMHPSGGHTQLNRGYIANDPSETVKEGSLYSSVEGDRLFPF